MQELLKGLPVNYLAGCDFPKTGVSFQAFVRRCGLVPAAERLLAAGYFLEDLDAVDCAEGYVVSYHFAHWDRPGRLRLRVLAPHDDPRAPSIAGVYQGAEWHEREVRDFHGVRFDGNPNLVPLLLDPDMADCFPLRKTEKARAKMRDILEAGQVLFCAPGFAHMTPDAPAAGAGDKA